MALLLVMGPTGVGKTTVIRELEALDSRFAYVRPWTTRPLRAGEVDKLSVTQEEMDRADARGEFLVINEFYGTRYATPLAPITNSLAAGGFPLIDWPVARLAAMEARFSGQLFRCYLRPPTLAVLEARLRLRDGSNERLAEAELEWTKMASGEFDHCVDLMATADDGAAAAVARRIHSAFLSMNGEVVNKHEQ